MGRVLVAFFCAYVAGCGSCGGDSHPRNPRRNERAAQVDVQALLANRRTTWVPEEKSAAIAAGSELLVRLDCNRCHGIDAVEPAARPAHCVSCHQFLDGLAPDDRRYRTLATRYGEAVIARYQRNIEHFLEVPDLTRIADRLRVDFLARYIANPHDLRPTMEETMVRVRVDEDEVKTLARYFAAIADRPYPPGDSRATQTHDAAEVSRGEQLFLTKGCTTCHTFGNLPTGRTADELRAIGLAARLAPNLRFVRERMDEVIAVAFILEPQTLHPGTRMPDLGLTDDEARAIAAFLFTADPRLEPLPAPPSLELPPVLSREVTYAEMKERVLGKVCVHCHMNDHERDPGPGNIGGFGYPAAHLRIRTYESLVSGAGPDDARRDVLGSDGTMPTILARMIRRRAETVRDEIPAFHDHAIPDVDTSLPGMPMGLPPMTDEELSILRTWIEQGCRGPTAVSGMPGIDDGFLVPDGPIAENHGCGRRNPDVARPAWSTAPPPAWESAHDAGTHR